MGGEKPTSGAALWLDLGSPPRGRGKVSKLANGAPAVGITPAWAGKRSTLFPLGWWVRDHPRVGGEKFLIIENAGGQMGSPPRGRGKAMQGIKDWKRNGITPAWAGKSAWRLPRPKSTEDHPRVGGEKQQVSIGYAIFQGSPPRGRGKVPVDQCNTAANRITPAWAGKSSVARARLFWNRDHPRVGGEKCVNTRALRPLIGSPPRGRGKAVQPNKKERMVGITPAWAGKRLLAEHQRQGRWDHPRVGGEKRRQSWKRRNTTGSPPRGRGKARDERTKHMKVRITPAWAGKSPSV